MLNAGKYNRKITIYQIVDGRDAQGFKKQIKVVILEPYAAVKTTKGFTLIANNSDFEKAYTNFTIRYSPTVINAYYNTNFNESESGYESEPPEIYESNRDLLIDFRGKTYKVQYLNNVNEEDIELEMQAKEVLK